MGGSCSDLFLIIFAIVSTNPSKPAVTFFSVSEAPLLSRMLISEDIFSGLFVLLNMNSEL